jgi:D-alanyl-D-alanine carboxypeptidase-like protein
MPENPSLDQSLPQLRAAEQRLRAAAQQMGISYALAAYGGMRTQADTNQILAYRTNDYRAAVARNPAVARIPIDQWRPIAPFGRSLHNWGAAFDIVITGAPAGWSRDKALAALGTLAPSIGLKWGGNFPRDRIDTPHFELPMSVVDARAAYLAYTQGKGYTGPSGPLGFLRGLFSSRSVPAVSTHATAPQMIIPEVSFARQRAPEFEIAPIVAAPLPTIVAPPVQAEDVESEAPRVIGRIGTSSFGQPTMMLAGDELGADQTAPVRTDVSDAVHLAAADEAKRRQNRNLVIIAVVVGGLLFVSRKRRRT